MIFDITCTIVYVGIDLSSVELVIKAQESLGLINMRGRQDSLSVLNQTRKTVFDPAHFQTPRRELTIQRAAEYF